VELGRAAEAIEHYERALSLNSGLAEVHQNLGSALAQLAQGRGSEAVFGVTEELLARPSNER